MYLLNKIYFKTPVKYMYNIKYNILYIIKLKTMILVY